jgi:hypothetical protein
MKDGYIQITLAMSRQLDIGRLVDFKVIADVYEVIPHGYFTYKDADGQFFSQFYGLSIGTPVDITVLSEPEDPNGKSKEKFEYPTFYITEIKNNCSTDSGKFAGNITVYFSHPWQLLKDVKNHAYQPMNSTELIKKVLQDESRGEKFTINQANFTKTDDSGKYSRYKVNETDFDFLMNKVLPYSSINQNPAHLYCDEKGDWWLRSFKELFKENSKIILGPNPEDIALEDVGKSIEKARDAGVANGAVYNTSNSQVLIGGKEIDDEIFPSFILENANSSGSATANKQPGNILKDHNGPSFGNLLPIDSQLMIRTTGTKTKTVLNRSLLDAFTLLFAGSDILDHMFRVAILTDFSGSDANLGNTAEVIVPKVLYDDGGVKEKGKYDSWLSGKWLITRIEHGVDTENTRKLTSRLFLSRPSFVGNEKKTSIVDIAQLFEVY